MIIDEEDYLMHYGTPRHSGRYPWGSGGDVEQRNKSFLDHVEKLKSQGVPEKVIAEGMGITTTELRARKSIAKHEQKAADIAMAQRLKEKSYSNIAIGKRMGINESSVRALLADGAKDRNDILYSTANMLKDQVARKELVDIGRGAEQSLGISETKLKTAVALLKEEGYKVHTFQSPQIGATTMTTYKILCPPDITKSYVIQNRDKISQIAEFSDDGGRTYVGFQPPLNINSKRVGVTYGPEGAKADGIIYVRPGVEDVSIGKSRYSQVRVAVDGTHYLKGMAIYKDDLPPGVDLMVNTPKANTGNKHDAFKKMEIDPETGKVHETRPFGSEIKDQIFKRDSDGNLIKDKDGRPIVSSSMNIIHSEGDWSKWKRNLSSQVLSKQNPRLIKGQLDMTFEQKKQGLDEIMSLTNPVVRKKLLEEYADGLDSSAVHLSSVAIPRSAWHVIIPVNTLKENEVFAPNYRDGERVALIRYPHGGIFEIPELVVNNRNKDARATIGHDAPDAIAIHHKVAEKLSGADFDGDHVIVIPNDSGQVKSSPSLKGLKDFDPKTQYKAYEGMPRLSKKGKGLQMGSITNLIADMSIQGANQEELARAVRHSMVVIDAEKHYLNYKQSAIDNGIPALKKKYQPEGGASTLITRAGSEAWVDVHKPRRAAKGGPIDKATGKKVFEEEPESFVTKEGQRIVKKKSVDRLAVEEDAFNLTSGPKGTAGTVVEQLYATHSNKLKALANVTRKEMVNITPIPVNKSAKITYADEVKSLEAKLNLAKRNAPLERQAQLIANTASSAKKAADPSMERETYKKVQRQALAEARSRTGAAKLDIWITDKEWDAIQSNAISTNKLEQILDKANSDRVKQLATPRATVMMTPTKRNRASAMLASGYTQAEVANALGVSLTTLKTGLSEGG